MKTTLLPRTLVNGFDFETLAPGAYTATADGKNGCTGSAKISFNVKALAQNVQITSFPSWKKPNEGQSYKGPAGDVWFGISMPGTLKDIPNVGCCEFDFWYRDPSGAWKQAPSMPLSMPVLPPNDPSGGEFQRSISSFKEGTQWRVRARAYKFQTTFAWNDWLHFTVQQ